MITLKAILTGSTEEEECIFDIIRHGDKKVGKFQADLTGWQEFKDSLFVFTGLKTVLKELKIEKVSELLWDLAHTYRAVSIMPYTK